MTSDAAEVRRLILDTRMSLSPPPFPPRRDLDFTYIDCTGGGDVTAFHDVFWPRQDQVACVIARVGGGERGLVGAHGLRALLRAALRRYPAGRAVNLAVEAFHGLGADAPVDAAAACLSSTDGAATAGTCGAGAAHHLFAAGDRWADLRPSDGAVLLAVGDRCRLSIAGSPGASGGDDDDLACARRAVGGRPGASAAVLALRALRASRGRLFVLSNDVAEIGPVLAQIEGYLLDGGVWAPSLAGLDVALDELLTNVVLYAYGDGQGHEVTVELRLEGTALTIEIHDDGSPFDPTAAAAPHGLDAGLDDRPIGGLGLHFARSVFDRMAYRRVRGWNTLRLSKVLASPPEPCGPRGAAAPERADGTRP